jgi:hypothetical protein
MIHNNLVRPTRSLKSKAPTMFSVNAVIDALYNNTSDGGLMSEGQVGPSCHGCNGGVPSNAWWMLNVKGNGFKPVF